MAAILAIASSQALIVPEQDHWASLSGSLMQRQAHLEEEIEYLKASLAQLELRVAHLEEREFDLVSSASVAPESSVRGGYAATVGAARLSSLPPLTPERERTLRDIGLWLRSCLEDRRRGLSGREKLPEGNSCYLVLRSFGGQLFNPVRVCKYFSEATAEVKPHGHPGDSIFIELPSFRDGRLVVEAAGLKWPRGFDDE